MRGGQGFGKSLQPRSTRAAHPAPRREHGPAQLQHRVCRSSPSGIVPPQCNESLQRDWEFL